MLANRFLHTGQYLVAEGQAAIGHDHFKIGNDRVRRISAIDQAINHVPDDLFAAAGDVHDQHARFDKVEVHSPDVGPVLHVQFGLDLPFAHARAVRNSQRR